MCRSAINSSGLSVCDRVLSAFSLHACAHVCVFVCVLACFTCVHAPRGKTGCVGCYLLLQRVTANHQPWQTLVWGEREEERENERGRGRADWHLNSTELPQSVSVLSSQSRYGFGTELNDHVASHLAHWQLIILFKTIYGQWYQRKHACLSAMNLWAWDTVNPTNILFKTSQVHLEYVKMSHEIQTKSRRYFNRNSMFSYKTVAFPCFISLQPPVRIEVHILK